MRLNYTRSKWSECSSTCGEFSWKGINRKCNRNEYARGYCGRRDLIREIVHCRNLPKCEKSTVWTPQNNIVKEACVKADITFIIDSSSSIGVDNFAITRMFVAKLIDASIGTYESDTIRFAAMRFAESNTRLWGWKEPLLTGISAELKTRLSYKESLRKLISDIKYTGRGTRTGSALKWSRLNFLKKEAGRREDVKNVFVVITDGKAQDNELVEKEGQVSISILLFFS